MVATTSRRVDPQKLGGLQPGEPAAQVLVEKCAGNLANVLYDEFATPKSDDRQAIQEWVVQQGSYWLLCLIADRHASPSDQRGILEEAINAGDFSVSLRDKLDNATWSRIATFYAGNKLAFWHGTALDPMEVEAAVREALHDLGPNPKGRPTGTWSLAQLQLAHGLAFVWYRLTSTAPTRQHDSRTGEPSGRFHDFVRLVVEAFSADAGFTRDTRFSNVDELAKIAVRAFSRAKQQGDLNSLRRIDEDLYLGPLPARGLSRKRLLERY